MKIQLLSLTVLLFLSACNETSSNNKEQTIASSSSEQNSSSSDTTSSSSLSSLMSSTQSSASSQSSFTISPQQFTDTTSDTVKHPGAYVTSQCYTKTEEANKNSHNPCFTCHINSKAPNYINDWDLQESYAFGEITKINPFTNLFKDRSTLVDAISDEYILQYIRHDNYFDENRSIKLAKTLSDVPQEWDNDSDGVWDGYTPDCYFNFDSQGFDRDKNNSYTGWRAFGYYPFLGTFWPTNGSTDDVLIRLHSVLQKDANGDFDIQVYKLNLAIVESLIKRSVVTIEATDENLYGVDLNQNGKLDQATVVKYNWIKPSYDVTTQTIKDFSMHYVGLAKAAQIDNELLMAPGLYPKGTEFLHTVRYIDVNDDGTIVMSNRLKELRYGVKTHWYSYSALNFRASKEIKEKDAFPDRLRTIVGNAETGLRNSLGWTYQGFIEDKNGHLRPQTREETLFCIGCHSGIGAVVDSTFVFPRKFDHNAKQMGWYHWTQKENAFKDLKEPMLADGRYEYTLYLEHNHAGDEFRDNEEVMKKFFDEDGNLKDNEVEKLHSDISHLIIPSKERALKLNKAYKVIVDEQSYIHGRDAHVKPVSNVHEEVEIDQETGIEGIQLDRYPLQ